jgi:hypothetical protein
MSRSLDWMDSALCRDVDPEVFFPASTGVKGKNGDWTGQRRQICRARWVCSALPITNARVLLAGFGGTT